MPFVFQCPVCGGSLTVPDEAAGKSGPCPRCKARITVVAPATRANANLRPCPSCGVTISVRAPTCHHCGDPLTPEGALPRTQPQPGETGPDLACAHCGSDQIQKVTAIVNAGTSSSGGAAVSWEPGPNGQMVQHVVPYHGTSTSRLASMLAAPAGPRVNMIPPSADMEGCGLAFLGAIFVGVGLWCAVGLWGENLHAFAPIPCVVAAFLVRWLWRTYAAMKERYRQACRDAERQVPQWKQAVARWEALYYCHRCDHVFDPNTGRSAAAQDMKSLLG